MRGTEPMYGYLVLAELIVVAVINLTVTHGAGAPTQSQTTISAVGLAAAAIFGAALQTRNRFVVGFMAIAAAFVITLPKVPNSVKVPHILALVIPLVYALLLTQRQRKASLAQIKSGRAPVKGAAERRAAAAARREGRQERRRGRQPAVPSGPAPNRRYTPPKAKRRRP
jgi:hypothetical protein